MDERVTQELSAYLDDELGPDERARITDLLASSTEARAELDRLTAGRDSVRAGATAPSAAEAARLDAGVLGAATVARLPTGPRHARTSPRKQGRPPWPYFAAAASFAVVLSLGIVVLAQVFGRGSTNDTASVATPTAATAAPTTEARAPATEAAPSPGSAEAYVPPLSDASPPHDELRPGPASRATAAPELYLSGIAIDDSAGLAALARGTSIPAVPRDQAVNEFVDLGRGAGLDGDELARCLGAATPGIPVRVDVGTFAGTPAYLVVLADPGSSAATVVALARPSCATLGTASASQ